MIKNIYYILFCIIIIALHNQIINAQESTYKVKLIAADILKYDKTIKPDYQILEGNVIFEYENSLLHCDRALIYLYRDYVAAEGNVHIIVNDTTHIYGDTLLIDGDNELTEILGNVKLIDKDITLITEHLYYDLKDDYSYYLTGGEITDHNSYLRSEKGYYYQKTKNFYFKDSVYIKNQETEIFSDTLMYNTKTEVVTFFGSSKIIQPENTMSFESGTYDTQNDIGKFSENVHIYSDTRIIKSDSLYYNKPLEYSEAFNNVFFHIPEDNIILNSHYGRFYEDDSTFFATDSALLRIVDKADTLHLHADTLYMISDTVIHKQKVLFAYNNTRTWRKDFQFVCDSAVYLNTDSVMYLHKDPIMWMDDTQLLADTIYLTYKNEQLEHIFLLNDAFIVSQESTKDFQQIKSNNMKGIFIDNQLDVLWANDSAETLYYVFDDDMLLIGINKTKSEKVKISFIDEKVDNVVFYNSPNGTLSPENKSDSSQAYLENFRWEHSKRPKYPADVFRNPATEPEAKELTVLISNNIDSAVVFSDTLSVTTYKHDIQENEEKFSENNEKQKPHRKSKFKDKEYEISKTDSEIYAEKKEKKDFFLKRWFSKLKCKKKKKYNFTD